jgi:hypothetical protein
LRGRPLDGEVLAGARSSRARDVGTPCRDGLESPSPLTGIPSHCRRLTGRPARDCRRHQLNADSTPACNVGRPTPARCTCACPRQHPGACHCPCPVQRRRHQRPDANQRSTDGDVAGRGPCHVPAAPDDARQPQRRRPAGNTRPALPRAALPAQRVRDLRAAAGGCRPAEDAGRGRRIAGHRPPHPPLRLQPGHRRRHRLLQPGPAAQRSRRLHRAARRRDRPDDLGIGRCRSAAHGRPCRAHQRATRRRDRRGRHAQRRPRQRHHAPGRRDLPQFPGQRHAGTGASHPRVRRRLSACSIRAPSRSTACPRCCTR